jgi:hypothetical protein
LYNVFISDPLVPTKGQNMLGGKPSTRLHEVIDTSYQYTMIVHTGSKSACNAYWLNQPAKKRQDLEVRVAKR